MATPLTADQLVTALRREGLRVVEYKSWRTHNRNHKGPWGPVHGVMIHHTVTKGTASTVELCYAGHSTLPGPLCHGVIAKDGTVYLVGNGRANHAGLGDDDVLRAVVNESAPLPADNETNTDGNRYFYGFECENLGDGKDPWPEAQLEAIEKASAALCRIHGWSHRSVIGHLEWQPGKIDPRGFTMPSMRDRIRTRLTPTPAPSTGTTTPTNTGADVARILTDDDIRAIWAWKNLAIDPRDMRQIIDDIPEDVARILLRTDGQYLAPKDAADWSPDPADSRHWWSGTTVFDSINTAARENRARIADLERRIGLIMDHFGITDPEA